MTYLILGIVTIIVFVFIAMKTNRISFYSPLGISSIVWFSVFIIGLFCYKSYFPITLFSISAWFIWYTITSILFLSIYPKQIKIRQNYELIGSPFWFDIILLILISYSLLEIWHLGTSGISNFFFNLRSSSIAADDFDKVGFLLYFYSIGYAIFIFENININKYKYRTLILSWIFMLLYAILQMSKLSFITTILTAFVINCFYNRIKLKYVFILLIISIICMVAIHNIRVNQSTLDTTEQLDASTTFTTYTFTPLVAL